MDIPFEFHNLKKAKVTHHPRAYTVGEVVDQLKRLPPDLPVESGFGKGVELIVFNVGAKHVDGPHLDFHEISEGDM